MRSEISIPIHISHDFDWKEELSSIKEEKILWKLDFGCDKSPMDFYDSFYFQSFLCGLEEFSKQCLKYPTIGVSLYQGDLYFKSKMVPSENYEKNFADFLKDYDLNHFQKDELEELFCTSVFSEYLQRLATSLPDSISLFIHLDVQETPLAKVAHLICKRRFEHLKIILQSDDFLPICFEKKTSIGFAVPLDEYCNTGLLEEINQMFLRLQKEKIIVRVIPEESLNENWEELEAIIVHTKNLSSLGRRGLLGFAAAGGIPIYFGEPLGLEGETTFERFLKEIGAEGFEPPTHCSQSSCASQTALCSDFE